MKELTTLVATVFVFASLASGEEDTPITVETMPPSVVSTLPRAGASDVDPSLNEIRVAFSKDMMTEQMWAVVQISKDHFPKTREGIHFLEDKRTCVIPVQLVPDKTYVLWFNKGRFNSFRDTRNNPAVPYLLVFRTRKSEEQDQRQRELNP